MSILLPPSYKPPSRLREELFLLWIAVASGWGERARHYASHRVPVVASILTFAPTLAEALTLTPSPREIVKRARSGLLSFFSPLPPFLLFCDTVCGPASRITTLKVVRDADVVQFVVDTVRI